MVSHVFQVNNKQCEVQEMGKDHMLWGMAGGALHNERTTYLSDGVSVGTLSQGGRSWAVCCQGSGGDGLIDGCVGVSTQDGTMNTGCEGSKANNFETHVIVGGRV